MIGLSSGFTIGFLFGFVFGSVLGSWHFLAPSFTGLMARFGRGIVAGAVFGYVGALLGGLRGGLEAKPSDLARVTSCEAVLARDRRVALLIWLVSGIALGLVGGYMFELVGGLELGVSAGLAAGLVLGFVLSVAETAWPSYMLARGRLALRHRLPWSLMDS